MLDEKQAKVKAKELEKMEKEKRLQKLKSQVIVLLVLHKANVMKTEYLINNKNVFRKRSLNAVAVF